MYFKVLPVYPQFTHRVWISKTHLELPLRGLPSFVLLKTHILILPCNFFAFVGLWIMVIALILFLLLIYNTPSHLPIPDHGASSHVKLSFLLQPRTGWPYSSFLSLSSSLQKSCLLAFFALWKLSFLSLSLTQVFSWDVSLLVQSWSVMGPGLQKRFHSLTHFVKEQDLCPLQSWWHKR